jgi:hypothetical protein
MIDWVELAANALWVFGLAWILAILGWRRAAGARLLDLSRRSTALALAVFCLGVCLSTSILWQRILWGILTLGNLSAAFAWRRLERLMRREN